MNPINILGAVLILIVLAGLFVFTVVEVGFRGAVIAWLSAIAITAVVSIGTYLMCV